MFATELGSGPHPCSTPLQGECRLELAICFCTQSLPPRSHLRSETFTNGSSTCESNVPSEPMDQYVRPLESQIDISLPSAPHLTLLVNDSDCIVIGQLPRTWIAIHLTSW